MIHKMKAIFFLCMGLCGAFGVQAFEYQPQEWDGQHDVTLNTLASWIKNADKHHVDTLRNCWDNQAAYDIRKRLAHDSFSITSQDSLDALRADCMNAFIHRLPESIKHTLSLSLKDVVKDIKKVHRNELKVFEGCCDLSEDIFYLLQSLDLVNPYQDYTCVELESVILNTARSSNLYEEQDIKICMQKNMRAWKQLLKQYYEKEYYDLSELEDLFMVAVLFHAARSVPPRASAEYRAWYYRFTEIMYSFDFYY